METKNHTQHLLGKPIPRMALDSIRALKGLQYPSGLFGASKPSVSTGYDKAWIRDNLYEILAFEAVTDFETVEKNIRALFSVFLKHESHLDRALAEKPSDKNSYLHARYCPITFNKFDEAWGNKQNDAVGFFLFKVGQLQKNGINVVDTADKHRIVQKLANYLIAIEYWHDKDNGVWEENEEIHASSVGACVAGLKAVQNLVFVPQWAIDKGKDTLDLLLPGESVSKQVDLALLSLIYPLEVVSESQRKAILENVENHLVRSKGLIRYRNDRYYNRNGEAEWCFGFPWLAIIYKKLGNEQKYQYYLKKTRDAFNQKGELPELYYADSNEHNENSPLGWAQSLYVVAVVS